MNKVLFVEGKTDKRAIIDTNIKEIEIICTFGTVSYDQLEELIEKYENDDCYLLFDEDYSGDKLRKQFIQALPNSKIIRIPSEYKEVAKTPIDILTNVLKEYYLI